MLSGVLLADIGSFDFGNLTSCKGRFCYTYGEQPRKAGKATAKAMSWYTPRDGTHPIMVSCRRTIEYVVSLMHTPQVAAAYHWNAI